MTETTADFEPGSFGCHEAMDRAMLCYEFVAERLCSHPAIEGKPEWLALADAARQTLFDLYQAIGQEHMQK